jgi:hypothetical protein
VTVSRYANVGTAIWAAPDGTQVPYLQRRLLPARAVPPTGLPYTVRLGDRVDTIAAIYLSDATLSWMLGDANLVMRPTELAMPGRVILIPQSGGGMSLG